MLFFFFMFNCTSKASINIPAAPQIESSIVKDLFKNNNLIYKNIDEVPVGNILSIDWEEGVYKDKQNIGRVKAPNGKRVNVKNISSAAKNSIQPLNKSGNESNMEIAFHNTSDERFDLLEITYEEGNKEKKAYLEVAVKNKVKSALAIYIGADNNLNGVYDSEYDESYDFVKKDIDEIVGAFKNMDNSAANNSEVIVFLDTEEVAERSYNRSADLKGKGIYLINKNGCKKIRDIQEVNTGDQKEFEKFLNYIYDLTETDRLCLDIWGHGKFVLGALFDDNTPDMDSLTPRELKDAISNSKIENIDLLIFSACLMQDIGVAGMLPEKVKYVCGCPEAVPGDGSFYGSYSERGMLQAIFENNDLENRDIAKMVCDINYDSYFNNKQQGPSSFAEQYLAYSSIKVDKIAMDEIIKLFSEILQTIDSNVINNIIASSINYSYVEGTYELVDFGDLVRNMREYLTEEDKIKADRIVELLREIIINSRYVKEDNIDTSITGLTILADKNFFYFPEAISNEVYQKMKWSKVLFNN